MQVRPLSGRWRQGQLSFAGKSFRCALGRSGLRSEKREGDGATPRAAMRLVRVFWRADRGPRPRTRLPVLRIDRAMGWCDASGHRLYNRLIRLPFPESHEEMWRPDGLYDLVVELDWNCRPRIARRGSAIFMHVAQPGYSPTAGCVALRLCDLRRVLSAVSRNCRLVIK